MCNVPLDHRRLLGHHVHQSARSVETYNRQVLIPAARAVEKGLTGHPPRPLPPRLPPGQPIRRPQQHAPAGRCRPGHGWPPQPDPTNVASTTATPAASPSDVTSDSETDTSEPETDLPPPLHRLAHNGPFLPTSRRGISPGPIAAVAACT